MKTIKIPYSNTIDNLLDYRKQFSNVVRYSYNRFIDNQSKKDIRNDVKLLNNIGLIHRWKERVELDSIKDWKELFGVIKNLKLKYRVSLSEIDKSIRVFSLINFKSKTNNIVFEGR